MREEKRMIEKFEITQSLLVGGNEIVMGVDMTTPIPSYLLTTCVPIPELNIMQYEKPVGSEDYLELMEEFISRVQTELTTMRAERQERQVGNEPLTTDFCIPVKADDDLNGKLLVVKPSAIRPECRTPDYQLVIATGGFGCSPHARGRTVFAKSLYNGRNVRWERQDIMGIAKHDKLPQWAQEKVATLQERPKQKPKRKEQER